MVAAIGEATQVFPTLVERFATPECFCVCEEHAFSVFKGEEKWLCVVGRSSTQTFSGVGHPSSFTIPPLYVR